MDVDLAPAREIIEKFRGKKAVLIPLLQALQGHYGYVPRETVALVSDAYDIPEADIYGVLTFYAQFYLEPRGKYPVRVCQGTACYIMGGKELLDHLKSKLEIKPDETTSDGLFTLEVVACLGCCGMAPVVAMGEKLYGGVSIQKMDSILAEYREKEQTEKV